MLVWLLCSSLASWALCFFRTNAGDVVRCGLVYACKRTSRLDVKT